VFQGQLKPSFVDVYVVNVNVKNIGAVSVISPMFMHLLDK